MPLIYYALIVIIGTIAIAILFFTFVITRNYASNPLIPTSGSHIGGDIQKGSSAQLNQLSPYSATYSSFKYKKRILENVGEAATADDITECVVCLLGFEDGEELRQLHRCNHSFHAPCIDMWMYSHSSCPICRINVWFTACCWVLLIDKILHRSQLIFCNFKLFHVCIADTITTHLFTRFSLGS